MLANVTHILPVTQIRRRRLLPMAGKLLIRKGQKVHATEVVAEAILEPEHLLLDVSRTLGVSPETADEHIQVKPGDQVAEGDILAGPVGLTRRVLRSPRRGKVALASGGILLLQVQEQCFSLKAGLSGVVVELISDLGVEIEANGALIQGVWGNGQIGSGSILPLATSPAETLTPDRINLTMRGGVGLAGYIGDVEVLKAAAEVQLMGLIAGSMAPNLIEPACALNIPLILIDGFASSAQARPMNGAAFKLLSTSERRVADLNAEAPDPYTGARPEITIALPAGADTIPAVDMAEYTVGQKVRILSAYSGTKHATLTRMRGMVTHPGGARTLSAEVRLDDGALVDVPLANLEVLI